MPKAEKGSLKDLGKRIKAKGLQKLKFYCQMCEKQCRDANGFKCHLTSESHLRHMKIFADHAGAYMDRYSREFETMFVDTLRMRHGTASVNANHVYQEVIQDKQHIHMNATIWATLTDFCKYLGKTGQCVVQETERGWYVSYVERDATKLQREQAQRARQVADAAAEAVAAAQSERQRIAAAQALERVVVAAAVGNSNNSSSYINSGDQPKTTIQLAIPKPDSKKKAVWNVGKSVFGGADSVEEEEDDNGGNVVEPPQTIRTEVGESNIPTPVATLNGSQPGRKRSPPSDTRRQHPAKQQNDFDHTQRPNTRSRQNTNDTLVVPGIDIDHNNETTTTAPWLYRDILVRIVNTELLPKYYFRRKARVDAVDGYTATVTVVRDDTTDNDIDDKTKRGQASVAGHVLRLDQEDLETVAPKKVKHRQTVRIVRGELRGEKAVAVELDKKTCRAVLELKDGTRVEEVHYDDFSLLS